MLIQEWRPRFDPVVHGRAIHLRQVFRDELGSPLVLEKRRQRLIGRDTRSGTPRGARDVTETRPQESAFDVRPDTVSRPQVRIEPARDIVQQGGAATKKTPTWDEGLRRAPQPRNSDGQAPRKPAGHRQVPVTRISEKNVVASVSCRAGPSRAKRPLEIRGACRARRRRRTVLRRRR